MVSSGVQPTVRFVLLENRVPSKYFREDYQNIFMRVPILSEYLTCWDEKFKAKGHSGLFLPCNWFLVLAFKTGFLCIPLSVLKLLDQAGLKGVHHHHHPPSSL